MVKSETVAITSSEMASNQVVRNTVFPDFSHHITWKNVNFLVFLITIQTALQKQQHPPSASEKSENCFG